MPALTRKRVNDRPVTWHVHFDGVRVGVIVERSGVARAAEIRGSGIAASIRAAIRATIATARRPSFEAARAAFEAAWRDYLPRRSEADFQEWRDQDAWTAEKYRRFDRGERKSPNWRPSFG